MKKRTGILIITALLLIIGGYFMLKFLFPKVSIPDTNARLNYVYNDKNIIANLSIEESKIIKNMFNGKRLYDDNPSCGFTDNVSISFDSLIFCVACDKCPIIKYNNKYFKISEKDRTTINEIFERFGGSFPCI